MSKHKNITLMLFRLNKQAKNNEKKRSEKQTHIQTKNQTKPEQTAATTTINIYVWTFFFLSDKSVF